MKETTWFEGTRFTIVLLSEGEESEFEAFRRALPDAARRQVNARLVFMANEGPTTNRQHSEEA